MEYIETNLADTISFDEIAQRAFCSTYHFQRMFPFITGVSLSEYIRRRRLTSPKAYPRMSFHISIKCDDDGSVDHMNDLLGRFGDTMLHAALYDHTKESFKYMICYHAPKGLEIPEKFTKLAVLPLTWALFPEP
ncbi:hypothetical protein [Paenibacillus sp. SAF-068]|uniref:hypothetical protein n=1 Tax=Paenibacillus sp. SAF-068 TaxID=3436864 RepID=UPI003F7D554E